jgi:hypothetical protein
VTLREREPASERWAHLPGDGRGPVQPGPLRFLRVRWSRAVKPLALVAFVALAVVAVAHVVPSLFGHGKGGLLPATATPSSSASVKP